MTSSVSNIKRGAARITWDGTDLGWTKGGLKVKVSEESIPISVDQFGECILDELIKGKPVVVSAPLAETGVIAMMDAVFANQTHSGTYAYLVPGVAIDRYTYAAPLQIDLMTSATALEVATNANQPSTYLFYSAIPTGPLDFSREWSEGAEVVTVEFKCYPASHDSGTFTTGTNYAEDATKSWTTNQWVGFEFKDSAGATFIITASTGTRLTVTGTPAAGTCTIDVARYYTGTGTGTLNTWTVTGTPWVASQWRNYVLTDDDGDTFTITANTTSALTVIGTPTTGDFKIGVAAGTGIPRLGYRGKV